LSDLALAEDLLSIDQARSCVQMMTVMKLRWWWGRSWPCRIASHKSL